jgi:hypothetical protein
MTDTVHFDDNVGRIAYEAWVSEFHESIGDADSWYELTETAQAAWEDVGETILENRVRLPRNGVEVIIRRPTGTIGFVWVGKEDGILADNLRMAIDNALAGA